MIPPPPRSTLFPYTTLFRSCLGMAGLAREVAVLNKLSVTEPVIDAVAAKISDKAQVDVLAAEACPRYLGRIVKGVNVKASTDRKSTRLNSSHVRISYAVFCL